MDKEYSVEISFFEKHLHEIAESILSNDLVVNVSSKSGSIVVISKEKYDSLIETLFLVSDINIKQSIIDGINASHDECVEEDCVSF